MTKTKATVTRKSNDTGKGLSSLSSWKTDLLFIAIIILVAFTVRYIGMMDNGVTSDEPAYVLNGAGYLENLTSMRFDVDSWSANTEHPPVSKYIYGLAVWPFYGTDNTIESLYFNAKLASVIMGVLTCVIVFLTGREFFDRNTGFVAAVLLSLIPTFIAHTQIAALESPLALFVTLTLYLYMLAIKKESNRLFLASAIAFTLVISTKYNGLIILPVMVLFFLYYRLSQIKAKEGRLDAGILRANLTKLVPWESVITFAGITIIMFFLIWPLLWTGPIDHLLYSLDHWTYPIHEYLFGVRMSPPLYYYPVYFMATLPELLFLPLIVGIYDVIKSRSAFKFAVLLWFIVPFGYNLSSFIQDGMRYIFIIYPAVALLCAFGLLSIAGWISKVAGNRLKVATASNTFWALAAITTVYLIITVASFYPYYLDYYNVLTGGPKNVQEHRLFKWGWWGEGIKECMLWVNNDAPADASVMMFTFPEDPWNTWYYTGDQFYMYPWLGANNGGNKVYTFSKEPFMLNMSGRIRPMVPDYVIINQKLMEDANVSIDDPAYTIVYNASVRGVPVCQVYKKTD